MPRYHFSLGNSSQGSVGFCAAVIAPSEAEALERLKSRLPCELAAVPWNAGGGSNGIEYLNVYFNERAITCRDIDDIENEVQASE